MVTLSRARAVLPLVERPRVRNDARVLLSRLALVPAGSGKSPAWSTVRPGPRAEGAHSGRRRSHGAPSVKRAAAPALDGRRALRSRRHAASRRRRATLADASQSRRKLTRRCAAPSLPSTRGEGRHTIRSRGRDHRQRPMGLAVARLGPRAAAARPASGGPARAARSTVHRRSATSTRAAGAMRVDEAALRHNRDPASVRLRSASPVAAARVCAEENFGQRQHDSHSLRRARRGHLNNLRGRAPGDVAATSAHVITRAPSAVTACMLFTNAAA